MCDGGVFSVPIAMAIIGAGTAVYMRNEQKKAIAQQAAVQQEQIDNKAQVDKQQRINEARQLRATARAAAAESAVSGNSLAMIENDIVAQAGRDVSLIESNRKMGIESSQVDAAARTRLANAEMWSNIGSSAASGAAGAYSNYTIKNSGGS